MKKRKKIRNSSNRSNRSNREKNGGFSFVELLVAVIVLAIISVPIMHAFVSSAKTNAKAAKIAQATTIAQNAMEKIHGEDLEHILSSSNKTSMINEVTMEKTTSYEYTIASETIDGVTYEVTAELTPDLYREDVAQITDYNQTEMAQLFHMDVMSDAIYIQDANLDEEMAKKFSGDVENVIDGMQRNIVLHILTEDNVTQVNVEISYTWNGKTLFASQNPTNIYKENVADAELQNIYLFYNPLSYYGTIKENILICNQNLLPVSVYLVRQGQVLMAENSYKVGVQVLEPNREDISYLENPDKGKRSPIEVLTHIRTNVSWENTIENGNQQYQQMVLTYGVTEGIYGETKQLIVEDMVRECSAVELTGINSLSGESAEERVYKVTVKVYEAGSDKWEEGPLVSISGTKTK